MTDSKNLRVLFSDWQQVSQVLSAYNAAFNFFHENKNDLEKIINEEIIDENEKIAIQTLIKKINLAQKPCGFISENILQIAQKDVRSIININSIIEDTSSTYKQIERITDKLNYYEVSTEEADKLGTFNELKKLVDDFNTFARENHLKELPTTKSDKEFEKDFVNFNKLLDKRKTYESKKKDYFLLVQTILDQQTRNGIITKTDNGKYKIINKSEFDRLGPATRSLISNYLEVQVEEHESITETTDRLHTPEINDGETEEDARRLLNMPPPPPQIHPDTQEEVEEGSKQTQKAEIKEKVERAIETGNIETLAETLEDPQCLTESVGEIKQNVERILAGLNESSARDTKSSKDAKNKILAIKTVKDLEEKTGEKYSDGETLLIAQRKAWDLEDEDRRNLFLSNEITYMPECQKFPNGKENIACPCEAKERMKDEKTIELTLKINGRNIGLSDDTDITIILELGKPITSSDIVEFLRDRRMDEIKRNSSCSIHVEPRSAERPFYRSFGRQEVEAVR